MKTILTSLVLSSFIFANSLSSLLGDVDKGQIYYKYLISPHLNYSGAEFTKKFTAKEWRVLFSNNGEKFFKEFNIKQNSIDKEVLLHLEAFAIYYAKDSDAKASCSK